MAFKIGFISYLYRSFQVIVCAFPIRLFALTEYLAANVQLTWNVNTVLDFAGYKVYIRAASRAYNFPVNVGNVTSYMVTGLNLGGIITS